MEYNDVLNRRLFCRSFAYLLSAVLIGIMCGLAVSCEKDIRDQLNPIEVKGADGTFEVNDRDLYLKNGHATLIATYCNADGLYDPWKIRVNPGDREPKVDGNNALFEFTIPGSYTVSAGSLRIDIKVME